MASADQIRKAMAKGIGFACATCDNFGWGVQHGLPACKANSENKFCAGPMGGGAFPEYSGPLKNVLTKYCFVCGRQACAAAEVKPLPGSTVKSGMVGVCEEHIQWLETYSRPNERPPFVTHNKIDVLK